MLDFCQNNSGIVQYFILYIFLWVWYISFNTVFIHLNIWEDRILRTVYIPPSKTHALWSDTNIILLGISFAYMVALSRYHPHIPKALLMIGGFAAIMPSMVLVSTMLTG